MSILALLIFQVVSPAGVEPPGAKYYVYLGEAGELQIKVSIWGEVESPGLYSIPEGTDLATLLSLVGGPKETANLSNVDVIHSFPVPSVTSVDLRPFFKSGNRAGIPILKPGDMVRVKPSFYTRVKSFTQHITEFTLVILVYLQLYNLLK